MDDVGRGATQMQAAGFATARALACTFLAPTTSTMQETRGAHPSASTSLIDCIPEGAWLAMGVRLQSGGG